MSSYIIAKLNKEDSVNLVATLNPLITKPSTINFLSPRNSFWNFFSKNAIKESLYSVGSLLVLIYYLFRYILSI